MRFRMYQKEAIESSVRAVREGKHPVVILPTGSGKSLVAAGICEQLEGRILLATHRQELVLQDAEKLRTLIPGIDLGINNAGIGRRDVKNRIIFGGIASMYRQIDRLQAHGAFSAVIVDEAHCVPARDKKSMYRSLLDACPNAARIGLTATPYRLDSGLIMGDDSAWFDHVAIDVKSSALTPEYLTPIEGVLSARDVDVSKVHVRAGEFAQNELSLLVSEDAVVDAAVDEICILAEKRRSWLLFCVDILHVEKVTKALQARGVDAEHLTQHTRSVERVRIVESFREGRTRALVNCMVATTGFDFPGVDMIALLRPTMSKGLLVQMVGRGMRQAPGKEDCLVLDYTGNIERHSPLDEFSRIVQTDEREEKERKAAVAEEARLRAVRHAASALKFGSVNGVGHERYQVETIHYEVQQSRNAKYPGASNLVVLYKVKGRDRGQWVRTWLCLEYKGYARQKAEQWFNRRGTATPQSADAGLVLARRLPKPSEIIVDDRGQWPELISEDFDSIE